MSDSPIPFPKLAAPAQRALASGGFTDLRQLVNARKSDVAKLHGMGPNALKTLSEALATAGLSFREES